MANELKPCLSAFIKWTKQHHANWNLSPVHVNGQFSRFMDPDTDTAWMGFEAAWNTRPAPAATDTGLETFSLEMQRDYAFMKADPEGDYVARSRAEELLAAERAEKDRLYDSQLAMADGEIRMTATEEVLAHLLIDVIGAPDDVPYTPNQAQEVIERQLKRVRELDNIEEMLIDGQGDDDGAQIMPEFEAGWSTMAKVEECLHLLEKRRDVIEGFEADNAAQAARIKELEADRDHQSKLSNKLNRSHAALEAKFAATEKALDGLREKGRNVLDVLKAWEDDSDLVNSGKIVSDFRAALAMKP